MLRRAPVTRRIHYRPQVVFVFADRSFESDRLVGAQRYWGAGVSRLPSSDWIRHIREFIGHCGVGGGARARENGGGCLGEVSSNAREGARGVGGVGIVAQSGNVRVKCWARASVCSVRRGCTLVCRGRRACVPLRVVAGESLACNCKPRVVPRNTRALECAS